MGYVHKIEDEKKRRDRGSERSTKDSTSLVMFT
jgi:hypothetical protein